MPNAFEIHSVNELSSLSVFITDMNNLLPYAYISNIPMLYIRTPGALNLPEREDLRTITEKDFLIKGVDDWMSTWVNELKEKEVESKCPHSLG